VTTYAYDEANRVVLTTQPDGAVTRTIYTPAMIALVRNIVSNEPQAIHRTALDGSGNKIEFVGQDGKLRSRMMLGSMKGGAVKLTDDDSLSRQGSSTDPYGRVTTYQYNLQGKLIRTTFPDGTFTQQAWDANGRRTSATNERGQVTTYGYDALGRVVSVAGHDGTITHTYDEAGNRVTQTDALGRVTTCATTR
jgi:YD repeat-containing protein